MDTTNSELDPSIYLIALINALIHKLRTPLSTISNELTVLRNEVGAEQIERAERATANITDLLKTISEVTKISIKGEDATVLEFKEALSKSFKVSHEGNIKGLVFNKAIAHALNLGLVQLSSDLNFNNFSVFLQCLKPEIFTIIVEARTNFQNKDSISGKSLTELFNIKLGIDTVWAQIIDCFSLAQRASVIASLVGDNLRLEFTIPVCKADISNERESSSNIS